MKRIIYYLASVIILISCSDDLSNLDNPPPQEENNNYYFNINQTQINSSFSETMYKVIITTNTKWEISSKPDWVKISPENGNENIEIEVTLFENKNENSRNGNIEFKSIGKIFPLKVSQNGFPLKLVSYSGSESPIKMNETKFLLFNKAITLNSITSGEDGYFSFAGPNDIEYFDNNHGVKFRIGPSNLGSQHKYKFSVKDNDNNTLEQIVDLNFFSQKIIVPGAIKKMILDEDDNLWVLSLKVWQSGEPSYIFKFIENEGKYEEVLKFEVDIDQSNSDYVGGSFFINPYNNLIYIPDYEGKEVDVYSKAGVLIKHISIPIVSSDHPQLPHSSPVNIGFNNVGKGIISLLGKGISGIKWRFIDSSNNDILNEPTDSHHYYYTFFQSYVLNQDKSKLYVLEDRSSIIKVFNGNENFEEINLNSLYPNGADASGIVQNRLNNKIFISGLRNSQIIASDLSFISNQSPSDYLGDFCYNQNKSNHIYGFDGGSNFNLLDYDNKIIVFSLPLDSNFNWTHNRGIVTTPDNMFIITYSDRVDLTTSRSQIVIYSTKMFE